jgi:hypothetical protein
MIDSRQERLDFIRDIFRIIFIYGIECCEGVQSRRLGLGFGKMNGLERFGSGCSLGVGSFLKPGLSVSCMTVGDWSGCLRSRVSRFGSSDTLKVMATGEIVVVANIAVSNAMKAVG